MTPITIYGIPGSPYLRSAIAGCEEKGLEWRLCAVAPEELKSPAHLERHPFGRIPVIEHDGFSLYETQAILRYLDGLTPAMPLQPDDPHGRARMDQIIGILDWYIFPTASAVVGFERLIKPMFFNEQPDEDAIIAALPATQVAIDELDRLKGEQSFLVGDRLTLADLIVAPHLSFLAQTPEGTEILKGKGLNDWIGRMEDRPSFVATTWERLSEAA